MFDASHDAAVAAARAARSAQAAARREAIAAGLDPDFEEAPAVAQWQPPAVEPGPCDGCRFAQRCASELLCCDRFVMYCAGVTRERWSLAPRVPTRARYAALFGESPVRPAALVDAGHASGARQASGG